MTSKANSITVVAPIILTIGSPKLPESPRYLVKKHRTNEALSLLCRLHHSTEDPNDIVAREEFVQIQRQLEADANMPQGILAILRQRAYLKRYALGIFVQ